MFKRFLLLCLLTATAGAHAADEHVSEMFKVTQRFAEAGSKEGQFKLADMYEQGRGTPVNLEKARLWYEKAAGQGHAEARNRLDNWDARQAERERKRKEAELARQRAEERARQEAIAAKKRAEAKKREELEARKRAEEARARKAARQRAERERARKAAERKARLGLEQ